VPSSPIRLDANVALPPTRGRAQPHCERPLRGRHLLPALLEPSRSRAITRLARRAEELVVTSYRRTASKLMTWEPAAPLSTGPDGGRASNNAARASSTPGKKAPVRTRPVLRRTGLNDGPPRRPADGAADRSPRAAAARSRSGARPPAGIEPGNRAARRPPAGRRCRWSSGGSRSVYPSSRPAGTGRGCSVSSPVNWTTAASTTGTCPASAGHTGAGPAVLPAAGPLERRLSCPECPEPDLQYCSSRAPASTVMLGPFSRSGKPLGVT
jgi:hypothetical protein